MEGGASFFREDTVVVNPKEIPPAENDPLLISDGVEKSTTDGETTDDGSTSVNKRQKNHQKRYS